MTAAAATSRSLCVYAAVLVLLLVGAGAALYGAAGPAGNTGSCAATRATLDRLRPFARGEVAALTVVDAPKAMPGLAFTGPDGARTTLADLRGRTILLNLWATWCVPCRQEMPALDRLQSELGGKDFSIAAINLDTRNLEKPKAWLKEAGIRNLAYYADAEARTFQELKAAGKVVGLPTSILIDPAGCEIATLNGPADWSSPEAIALIRAALHP